jgi:hypothetical protein
MSGIVSLLPFALASFWRAGTYQHFSTLLQQLLGGQLSVKGVKRKAT